MVTSSEDRWLSVEEIAIYLGVKRDTLYKWIDRGSLPAPKVGCPWKIRKDEVDEWVRSGDVRDGQDSQSSKKTEWLCCDANTQTARLPMNNGL